MANINTFAENLATLTKNTKDILEIAEGLNDAMSGNEAEVTVNDDIVLPSFSNVIKRVDRAENTIAKFIQGNGIIETDDGTFRKVKVSTISTPPDRIVDISTGMTFDINPNWFFENLQWPRCIVKIDLTDKIESSADRVYVKRVIIDTVNMTDDEISEIVNSVNEEQYDYAELVNYLTENDIMFYEDEDEARLPLTYEEYKGSFEVLAKNLYKNSKGVSELWYVLDTLSYTKVDENGTSTNNDYVLTTGDYLRFKNSLYKIADINIADKRVKLEYAVGYETLGEYDIAEFYNTPFSEKVISVGIGIDEINIVYVKGVNEEYNLLSREWSEPTAFYTNVLVYADSTSTSFAKYYSDYVVDFGKDWIAQAKEGRKNAYNGKIPNAPVLVADDLRVVQINTQLNATLDSEKYNNLTSDIASLKTNIDAIRTTIGVNKERLVQASTETAKNNIQNTIDSDTNKLNSATTQFSSLVEELNTLLKDTGAIGYTPKYHVRGFFAIPEPQYGFVDGDTKMDKQQVIGFEMMYRYIHTDNTGVQLDTFTYTNSNDASNLVQESGVFTDWNLSVSKFLEKEQDADTGTFNWVDETIDGTAININQIDIPLRSGEKVEIKVRSISECGYPYSPLKSAWSNSVIISFPDNLTSSDSVTTILDTVRDDMTSVVLQETLSAAGMYSHISDSNSIYKHTAETIQYTEKSDDDKVTVMSLYDKIKALESRIAALEGTRENTKITYSKTDASGVTYSYTESISQDDIDNDSSAGAFKNAFRNKAMSEIKTE